MQASDRLIVGLDGIRPRNEVLRWAGILGKRNLIVKVNAALRRWGYGLISDLHAEGCRVFADVKLHDIPETVMNDLVEMAEAGSMPWGVSIDASAGPATLKRAVEHRQGSNIIAITVLTSIEPDDCSRIYRCGTVETAGRLAKMSAEAGVQGLVGSGIELPVLRENAPNALRIIPGIRPTWSLVEGDDQKRIMTPAKAIAAGADILVMSRPILRSDDPIAAIDRSLEEIDAAGA